MISNTTLEVWLPALVSFVCLGVLGMLLAGVGLVYHRRGRTMPLPWHVLFAGLGVLAIGLGAVTWWLELPLGAWLSPLLFAAAYFCFFFLPAVRAERLVSHVWLMIRRPRARWAALLAFLVLTPLASAYLALASLHTEELDAAVTLSEIDDCLFDSNDGFFRALENNPVCSDRGRPIAVMVRKNPAHPKVNPEQLRSQANLLHSLKLTGAVIQISQGWQHCNCHGWTFSGGQFWIQPRDVPIILEDNGYEEVEAPRPNDVAVYRDAGGAISHTGIVRFVGGGLILVESKWGRIGRFLHPHDVHCYGADRCAFFRSERVGHFLQGVSGDSDSALPSADLVEHFFSSSPPVAELAGS
ncbi:MAG: hypothetical protein L0Y72_10530 [Gemmataceae bacterium]|nr:hypothetical protein [Gemmataceae bacterium]MCI0739469.1 hypothetical protein [Gemmataceae bacterium]